MTKPVVLCVLDGWGLRSGGQGNAIAEAQTPCMDRLFENYPNSILQASEGFVGLPDGQMGNSEVGHTNLGAGRVVMQNLPRINQAIAKGTLKDIPVLQSMIAALKASGGVAHVMGLLSPGGVHSHQDHFLEVVKILASHDIPVAIHAFLDGRDTPPKSAEQYLAQFEDQLPQRATIATLSGRYFAMDRDQRWDRVEKAYGAIVSAEGSTSESASQAIESSYLNSITDEFVVPVALGDYQGMKDGDGLIMINFRSDRAREILHALTDPTFNHFMRKKVIQFSTKVGMVPYSAELEKLLETLFPAIDLTQTLGQVVSDNRGKQLRIAETEKYAHVTFFFNGGNETMYKGEDRILIASPKVATYDLDPGMSAVGITDALIKAMVDNDYDLIVVNYANTDMVGHTGQHDATVKAVEIVDNCLDRLSHAVLEKKGALLITADHGNSEEMVDPTTGQPHTAHTLNPVPLILVADRLRGHLKDGVLADVAPTILNILGMSQPDEMTGVNLWEGK